VWLPTLLVSALKDCDVTPREFLYSRNSGNRKAIMKVVDMTRDTYDFNEAPKVWG